MSTHARIASSLIGITLLVLPGCGTGPGTTMRKLSSGETIRVLSVQRMDFNNGPPALVLRYQTDLNLDQQVQLAAEVERILPDIEQEAERAGLDSLAIISCEKPHGWPVYKFRTFGFVYAKDSAGEWVQTEAK